MNETKNTIQKDVHAFADRDDAEDIADAETDRILGAQCAGPHATDLISEMVIAVREELTATELGNTVHAHPTFAEIWMEAAHALHKTCIHAPPAR